MNTYVSNNLSYIKDLFSISTGHDHNGGTDDGVKVPSAGINFNGSIIPDTNGVYDLGDGTHAVRYLYVNNISFGGNIIPTVNNTYDFGDSTHTLRYVYTRKVSSDDDLNLHAGGGKDIIFNQSSFPWDDNTHKFGADGHRWTEVWAANGSIQTSDISYKKNIKNSDLGLEFINKLKPVMYKWKKQDDDRIHYGLIAQDIKKILGEDNRIIKKGEATGKYGLYYSELISPMIKAIQELSNEVDKLRNNK